MAESAKFTIGGHEFDVPALFFVDLEDPEVKHHFLSLGPTQWIEYSTHVLHIVAHQLQVPYDDLVNGRVNGQTSKCTPKEALDLAGPMNELLRVSGFDLPEVEATTESPGIGTSISSSLNSLHTESSGEISTQ